MNKIKEILKNETGSALVLSLMVLFVLSVLGGMVGVITIGSHKLADTTRDSNSAYYIAEAGANMAYDEIENHLLETYQNSNGSPAYFVSIDEFSLVKNGKEYSFDKQFGSSPKATVSVKLIESSSTNEKEYIIKSIGEVAEKSRYVEKKLTINLIENAKDNNLPAVPENASIIVKDSVKYLGGSITGDVYLDSNDNESFKIVNQGSTLPDNIYTSYDDIDKYMDLYIGIGDNSESFKNAYVSKTKPTEYSFNWENYDNYINDLISSFESVPMESTNYTNNGDWKEFNLQEKKIKTNQLTFQGQIKLNVGSSETIIMTNKLSQSWGNTQIIGEGSLTIIVMESVDFNGILNSNSGNLRIIFPKKNQNITIPNGAVITAQIIAPYSEVTLVNNYLTGNVIAKSFHATNAGGQIKPYNFKFSSSKNNELTEHTDIISSEPAIEN